MTKKIIYTTPFRLLPAYQDCDHPRSAYSKTIIYLTSIKQSPSVKRSFTKVPENHFDLQWNPPYDQAFYTTTSLLRQYSFDPNVRITESFYFCEDPVNATTVITTRILLPNGNALTGVHCINVKLNYTVEPR